MEKVPKRCAVRKPLHRGYTVRAERYTVRAERCNAISHITRSCESNLRLDAGPVMASAPPALPSDHYHELHALGVIDALEFVGDRVQLKRQPLTLICASRLSEAFKLSVVGPNVPRACKFLGCQQYHRITKVKHRDVEVSISAAVF